MTLILEEMEKTQTYNITLTREVTMTGPQNEGDIGANPWQQDLHLAITPNR